MRTTDFIIDVVIFLAICPKSEVHVVMILARYGVNLDDIYVLKFIE